MPRRLLATALTLLLATAALAACGGGGDDDALSTTDYRAQLGRLCDEGERAASTVAQPADETGPAVADFLEATVPIVERIRARVGALRPPADLAAAHAEYLRNADATLAESRRIIPLVRSSDDVERTIEREGERLDELNAQSDRIVGRLAVPQCND